MKKILLISFFNSTNIGDNAICMALQDRLSSFADVSIMDITGRPIIAPDHSAPKITNIPARYKMYNLRSFLALRKFDRTAYAESLIRNADLIMLAGGNMIMDLEKFSYFSYLANRYISYARKLNKKTAITFVGVGKIRTASQKRLWKKAIKKCDMVTVRDTISKAFMAKEFNRNDVSVWKDPVFLLDNVKTKGFNNTVGINVYMHSVSDPEKKSALRDTYIFLTRELQKKYNVVLYSTESMDISDLRDVYDNLKDLSGVSVSCPDTLAELLDLCDNFDFAVTTRMHAFIIAATQNIPTLIFSWDKKIVGVTDDLGICDEVYDVNTVYENREEILKKISSAMVDIKPHKDSLAKLTESIKSEFDTYIEDISKLMEV